MRQIYPQQINIPPKVKIMPLTDAKVRSAKRRDKQYKLFDGNGLFLLVMPNGSKYWRFKYRFGSKEKTLSFGVYPVISLLQARQGALEARKSLAQEIDPGQQKKARRQAQADTSNSFELIAREWHSKNISKWQPSYAAIILSRLECDVFPWLGRQLVQDIAAPDVLRVLRRIESRGAIETAHKINNYISQVMRYAVITGRADRDPAADLKGALAPVKTKHMAAITEPKKLKGLLRAIDDYSGSFIVKSALQFHALTFVRPGEVRHAEWSEIDFETAQWNISGEKMKMKEPHCVPLSDQAVSILKELEPLTRREGTSFVFPNARHPKRPMSENAERAALVDLGYKGLHTPHGFRATARTILAQVLRESVELLEHQLAHAVGGPNGRAYDRTSHLEDRREMMQRWSDYLDQLKSVDLGFTNCK